MTESLTIAFHGAAGSTTGSRHLLTIDQIPILLDCGLYQGRRKDTWEHNTHFGFDPRAIHTTLLSHAHIDHSGNLPTLVKQGFQGPIHCTAATADLCRVMLLDSAFIQEKDAEWLNKRKRKRGEEPIEPIYTIQDATRSLNRFETLDYHHPHHILRDVKVNFYDAGHILGSASIILDIRRDGGEVRFAFSGDIGRAGLPILRDPEIPHHVDWLVMESTYGAREHDDIAHAEAELLDVIQRVAARGGKIIVPSFSVERTQEIVYYLNALTNRRAIPPIPIYVDSPLSVNVTDIFRLHPECYDEEMRRIVLEGDPFGFHRLSYVKDVEESKRLNNINGPCMIISASGMCEGGRILHHLRNSIAEPRNCILFVGYQAEGTLGRKIVERQPTVNIFGEPHPLRAEVVTLNTMSGHADRHDLLNYARVVREHSPNLKQVFLVHGEPAAQRTLAETLRAELGLDVVIPALRDEFRLL